MNKLFINNLLLIITFNLLLGCQTVRDGFQGKKKTDNAEEFLINKKNPLVLPPDYSKLPLPESIKQQNESQTEFDIEDILKRNSSNKKEKTEIKSSKSLEKSILEKIKSD